LEAKEIKNRDVFTYFLKKTKNCDKEILKNGTLTALFSTFLEHKRPLPH